MTLGTILKSVLGTSGSRFYDYPTATESQKFLADRNGGGSEYYHHGHHKKSKGKSKSDKKHAILSALTLLAFLFFLNILQSCIREQNQIRGPVMMFAPVGPTGHQGKEPSPSPGSNGNEPSFRRKRGLDEGREIKNEYVSNRKSRTLLQFNEQTIHREPLNTSNRRVKFIRYSNNINNWTKELSQVSDKDLEDQKLKTLNFPLYWKNNRFASTELTQSKPTMNLNRAPEIPVLGDKTIPLMRRIKKRERTATGNETAQNGTKTTGTLLTPTSQKLTWDYKNPVYRKTETNQVVDKDKNPWHFNRTQGVQPNITWQSFTPSQMIRQGTQMRREATTASVPQLPTTQSIPSVSSYSATTPRNRRSDYGSTIRPSDYDDYERYSEPVRDDPQLPTPAVGLDLNTFQTFPIYNYYNHRPNAPLYRENQSIEVVTPESSVKPETMEIDRIHTEPVRVTTDSPLFHPTKVAPVYPKHPYYEKMKYRNRYPNYHGHYHTRNHYPIESRYRYSPYRKAGTYEPGHFHEDYYTPVVLAKYPQDDEPGFDLMKFFWTMFSSFAKPLTRLVPSFAKDNNDEAQCYDLLVCEAQRVSRFMGPTAEALAATVGTLLTWAANEDTRQIVIDAINSGRENTCQQQIRDCEDRSGGKSAMTVLAQVMEMKLR